MKKILLCGCLGKMGKVISQSISNFPNLEIVAGVDMQKDSYVKYPIFTKIEECNISVDVVLDFSRPEALNSLLDYCTGQKLPLVLCTTGYSEEDLKKIREYSEKTPVFRSANMSIGINLINSILKNISAMLYENYDIEIIEKHHNQKVDSPSGTALLLANSIKDSIPEDTNFVYGREGLKKRDHKEIGIHAIRGGSIVGDHEIIFAGQGEIIQLSHYALSREVFAIGALKASEFMCGKVQGLYTMDDVLK